MTRQEAIEKLGSRASWAAGATLEAMDIICAPLTVADAMSVSEVRDLVEWITEQIGEYAEHYHAVAIPECRPDERYHAAVRLLAPFLAAMKEEDHE